MKQLKGIFTALVTPFYDDESINFDALEALVVKNIADGVDGFYVGGSTGEAFLLSFDERKRILETVTKAVAGRCAIISHVGAISTKDACELAVHAASLKVDAVSAITPFYYKFSFHEFKKHYFEICEQCNLPMIVYNFPALSGVALTTQNIAELRENPLVMGVKHTSMDLFQLERMKNFDKDMLVYNGHDEVFLAGLSMGADGAIGTTYNFMGSKFVRIYNAFNEGNRQEAEMLQKEANEIIEGLIKVGVFQGTKYILEKQGIDCGICRKPFKELNLEDESLLDSLIKKYL